MPEKMSSANLVKYVGRKVRVSSTFPELHGMLRVRSVGRELVFGVLRHQLRRGDEINILRRCKVGGGTHARRIEEQVRMYQFTGTGAA